VPLRILLIEDSEDDAQLLVRELRKGGFDLDFARIDTPQALEAALYGNTWDAAIADYSMPAFTGLDALRIIRAKGLDLPFILVSGVIGEEKAVEAMKAGAHDYIMKGNIPRLAPALERELREAEVRRERRQALEELRRSHEELELRVQQRTAELTRANEAMRAEIAERKRAEEALRNSENKFSILFSKASLPAVLSRFPDHEFVDVNDAWTQLFGYTKEESIGKTSFDLGINRDAARRTHAISEAQLHKQVLNLEQTLFSKSGDALIVLTNVNVITIGGQDYAITSMQDITERKRAEEALQKANENLELRVRERTEDLSATLDTLSREISERKLVEEELREAVQFSEQVTNSAQEGVIVHDLNLCLRVWNPFMEQISGISAGDVLGKLPSEFFPFAEELGITERLEKVLSGEVSAPFDFPYFFPMTGRSGWASLLSSPFLNTKGKIIGAISTIQEISWRKQLENESRQALEAAKTANCTMSRLVRTIAHEFRTPLGLLTGSADILDRYWDRMTPEKRLEQNEHIRNAARQISNLVNSVTSFQLSGTDRPGNPPLLQDIEDICRSIAAEVETVWSAGHEFVVSIAADCGTALLDAILFRRILQNLLANAFQYTPTNGTVSLHVRREKNMLLLEIRDTGIGIPEEEQALIFDAFYRSRNVDGHRGLGLGLSIVREAVSQKDGTITVTSSVGVGTTMRVEIPVVDSL
jgi:PAS domain S-box-containing protein